MKKRFICIFISMILLVISLSIRIIKNYNESCNVFVEIGIKGDITKEINDIISNRFAQTDYNGFKTIEYSSNENISKIEINSAEINRLCNEISSQIFEMINDRKQEYGMPIGNTLGAPYLSGMGPEINIHILPKGFVDYEINSELISGGINQSVYRIEAIFSVGIQAIAPFHEKTIDISLPIVLSETLIVGEVPQILFFS